MSFQVFFTVYHCELGKSELLHCMSHLFRINYFVLESEVLVMSWVFFFFP